jgi:hypothetical protein
MANQSWNDKQNVPHRMQTGDVIYLANWMQLYISNFYIDNGLKMTKIGRNVLPE